MNYSKLTVACLPALLLTASLPARAQTKADSVTVEARTWNRDSKREVVLSDWKPFKTLALAGLPGYRPAAPPALSRYGGDATRTWQATGFIRAQQDKGRWWLVDPQGHPLLTVAMNSVRPGPSANSKQGFAQAFTSAQEWLGKTQALLLENGFNGVGAWSEIPAIREYNRTAAKPITYATMLNFLTAFDQQQGKTRPASDRVPKPALVFEPGWAAFCETHAREAEPTRDDANVLGNFSDNEIAFLPKLLPQVLALRDPAQPAYAAALAWLGTQKADTAHLTSALNDAFVGYVAGKYYQAVGPALKRHDPNHLYLGTRLHASAKFNRAIFAAAEPYVDLVSINFYGYWQPTPRMVAQWASWTKKPFFITEFYTKSAASGISNIAGAGWIVRTDADRGLFYQNFGLALLRARNCVGWHWFRYQDNDPSEPGPEKPDMGSNKGIVNSRYQPYPALLAPMKQFNDQTYNLVKFFDSPKK